MSELRAGGERLEAKLTTTKVFWGVEGGIGSGGYVWRGRWSAARGRKKSRWRGSGELRRRINVEIVVFV
jgi:hypothetical protein